MCYSTKMQRVKNWEESTLKLCVIQMLNLTYNSEEKISGKEKYFFVV